jgi:hypothetical protein
MLKIKRENFEETGHRFDYELENGVLLHKSEWNGETYTVKENGKEITYRPIQTHNEADDTWTIIGFDEE